MKKLIATLLVVSSVAFAADKWIGRIETDTANVSKSNSSTAATFNINAGAKYSIQCSRIACVGSSSDGGVTIKCPGYYDPGDGGSEWLGGSGQAGIELPAKTIFDMPLAANDVAIHAVSPDGGVTCNVYAVTP